MLQKNAAPRSAASPEGIGKFNRQPKVTGTAVGINCLLQKLKRIERTSVFPCFRGKDALLVFPDCTGGFPGAGRQQRWCQSSVSVRQ